MFEKIQELYQKRELLYKISSDFSIKIDINSNMYDTAEKIKKAYIES